MKIDFRSDLYLFIWTMLIGRGNNMLCIVFVCVIFRRHRGLRHHWGLKVRGQRTKTNGHGNSTVGFAKH